MKLLISPKGKKRFFIIIGIIIGLMIFVFWKIKFASNYPADINLNYAPDHFGVTYSKTMATSLGLDWKETYVAMLDDLKIKNIRIPIYWDEIEGVEGQFDFTDYDFMLNEGQSRGARFIINMGQRTARWPECHIPGWVNKYSLSDNQARVFKMLETTVNRYKDRPEVIYWQVENEPLLDLFGLCPKSDEKFLRAEVDHVKKIDSRPIIISASGELSSWVSEGKIGDIFGTTMYRVVWNDFLGYVRYPFPNWFYRLKALVAGIPKKRMFVIELQAEPWAAHSLLSDLPLAEEKKSFSLEQFKANVQYSLDLNFSKTYLWGVEWWYYKYKHGEPTYWEFAKTLFK
jgi:hypothetical protein